MTAPMRIILAALAMALGIAGTANASPATYTFTGDASGSVTDSTGVTTAFTNTTFTVVLSADTTAIDMTGPPFFRLFNVGGTFTEGAFSASFVPTITIVSSADPSLELINFFNATVDNGLGLHNALLNGYDLSTSIGPLPGDFLTPTFNGGSFALIGGGSVQFTDNTALTFTANVASASVPEPATLSLVGLCLAGIGFARRNRAG